MQSYDPYRLHREICELLERHGLRPDPKLGQIESGLNSIVEVQKLLQSLDIQPLVPFEDWFDGDSSRRYDTRTHGD